MLKNISTDKMKFYLVCRLLGVSAARLIKVQSNLGMSYYSDCTPEQIEQIRFDLKNNKKITSESLALEYKITMPTLSRIKTELGIPKGLGLSKKNIEILTEYLKGMPLSMNIISKRYKLSMQTIIRIKTRLGYKGIRILNLKQSKELEHEVKEYIKLRKLKKSIKLDESIAKKGKEKNSLTTKERCSIIKEIIKKDGFIKSTDITVLFNGLHIQPAITIIENNLKIDLYDDTVKELRYGMKESDKVGDDLKYKNVRVFMSQTELFAKWAMERKIWNGHNNSYQGNHSSKLF